MSFTQIENNPILISLTDAARSTGWSISGSVASHDGCVQGSIHLLGYPLTIGTTYEYSYQIITCSSGYVETFLGTNHGIQYTSPQWVHESVVADGTQLSIFATGVSSITNFSIRPVLVITDNQAQNTISFSEKTKKWVSFYSYIPEMSMSMFTKVFTGFDGDIYVHEAGSNDRNNFYGVQYQSIIQFVDNVAPAVPKTFQSLSIQCNELMVTTSGGIETSLGQISELASVDFVKAFLLSDGVSSVAVQTPLSGVYAANFLRDANDDLLNGTPLKGNYILITLISTNNQALLLYTINVVSQHSPIGSSIKKPISKIMYIW